MDPRGEDVPDWYPLMRAARYMRVAPWDLRDQSLVWRDRALIAEQAEAAHQEHMTKQRRRGLGRGSGKVH